MVPGSADDIEYGNRPITGYEGEYLRILPDDFGWFRMPSLSAELPLNVLIILPIHFHNSPYELFVSSERQIRSLFAQRPFNWSLECLKRILHIAFHKRVRSSFLWLEMRAGNAGGRCKHSNFMTSAQLQLIHLIIQH